MTAPVQDPPSPRPGPVVLAATQRCGSYLFGDLLSRYSGLPFPEEYLVEDMLPARRHLALPLDLPPGEVMQRLVADAGQTHGRFAIKVMWGAFVRFFFKLSAAQHGNTSFVNRTIRETWPNAQYLFIRRRDKIAQAVSFSRARQTGVWRTTEEEDASATPPVLQYDYRDIHGCWTRIQADERAWLEYFEKNKIPFHEVWYEDLVRQRRDTLDAALRFLGMTPRHAMPPESAYRRVSDGLNAEWAKRFTERLRAGERAVSPAAPVECAGLEVACDEPELRIPVGRARRVSFRVTNRGSAPVVPRMDRNGFLTPLLRLREAGGGNRVLAEAELEEPIPPGGVIRVDARVAASAPARTVVCAAWMEDDQGGAGPSRPLTVRFDYDEVQEWIARVFGDFQPSLYEGWIWAPALGALNISRFPWMYHCEHGWLRADPDASGPGALVVWDPGLGRLRLTLSDYPVILRPDNHEGERIRFLGTRGCRRLFSDAGKTLPPWTIAMNEDPDAEEIRPPAANAAETANSAFQGEVTTMSSSEPPAAPPLIIAATHRCGSYLFCDLLARYGGLPFPEEHLNENLVSARRQLALPADMPGAEVLRRLRSQSERQHGRFAIKAMWPAFVTGMFQIAREQLGHTRQVNRIIAELFPGAKYILVRRRNKIGQAVSYHRALLTGVWRSAVDEAEARPEPEVLHYSYRAIHRCWTSIQEDENGWLTYFKANHISWHEVWYEDLLKQRKETLDAALAYLGVAPRCAEPPDPGFRRVSDDTNREWSRRFEAKLQERLAGAAGAGGAEVDAGARADVSCGEPDIRVPVFGAGLAKFRVTNRGPGPLVPGSTAEGLSTLVLRLREDGGPDAGDGRVLAEEDLEDPVPSGGTVEMSLRLSGQAPEGTLACVARLERATGDAIATCPVRVRFEYDDAQRALAGIFGGLTESHWKGWVQTPVLGAISLRRFPWIYQNEHGWLKLLPEASGPGVLTACDVVLGPLRIALNEYPEMIRLSERRRIRFHGTKDGVRTFSDVSAPGATWTAPMSEKTGA